MRLKILRKNLVEETKMSKINLCKECLKERCTPKCEGHPWYREYRQGLLQKLL